MKPLGNLLDLRLGLAALLLILTSGRGVLAAGARVVRVVDQTIRAGQTGIVVVEMDANGDEVGVSFTINFDASRLTFVSLAKGSGVSGAALVSNTTQAASGRVGVAVSMVPSDPPEFLGSGTLQVARLTFTATTTVPGDIAVTFGDEVLSRKVVDVLANGVSASFSDGKVTVSIAPVANSQTVATDEDTLKTLTLTASQSGATGLAFSIVGNPANGTLSGTAPNLTYAPNANFNGQDSFTFRVSDGTASSDAATVSITVNPVNDVPVASGQSLTTDEDAPLTIKLAGTDIEGSDLKFTTVSSPTLGTLSGTAPDLTYTPNANASGTDSFTFTVNDGTVDSVAATIGITIAAVNDAPVANSQSVTADEDTPKVITLTGSDIEGSTLTFVIVSSPAQGTLSGTAPNIGYVPNSNATGQDSFTFKVNDGALDSAVATVSIGIAGVNDAPVAVADTYTVNEDSPLAVAAPGVLANDTDVDLNSLTVAVVSQPANGSVTLNADGSFAYVPNLNFNGTDSFTYKANDGQADSGVAAVTINVTAVNDTPTLASLTNRTIDEGTTLTFTVSGADVDGTSQTLSFSLGAGAPAGAGINATTGVFNWTPAEAQGAGSFPITILATDNGPQPLNVSQTFTVTVNEVNAAPTVAAIGTRTVPEGNALSFAIQGADVDLPVNGLTYSLEPGAPAGVTLNSATGVFDFVPTEAQGPGNFSITVRVTDNGTPSLSATQTFTVSVSELNSEPVLAPIGSQTVAEGNSLSVSASASDPDIPSNAVTFSLGNGAPAGMTIDPISGSINWTPTEAQAPGNYSVTVLAEDNGNPTLGATATFSVTVTEVNTAPTLGSIANQSVGEGNTINLTATASDLDVPAAPLTFSLDPGAPPGASINPTTGAFTWTTTEAQGPGSYTIGVRVSDGTATATQSFTVTVNEINTAPVMPSIGGQTVAEGTALLVIAAAADSDLPPNKLTFSVTGAPAGASLDPNSGFLTWTPGEEQAPSTNVMTIQVNDGGNPNLSAAQTFTLIVSEVNSPPVFANIPAQTIGEGSTLTFSAAATDPDIPANTLTYSLSFDAPFGMTINPTTGGVAWTPTEAEAPGTYNFTVQVSDNGNPSLNASRSVTVVVNEVNSAPALAPISNQTVRAGNLLTFTASGTDADIPPNILTYTLGAGAPAGASVNGATGAFSWTPTVAQGGPTGQTNSITLIVTDNGTPALSTNRTFSVVVTPSNTAPRITPVGNQTVAEGTLLSVQIVAADTDVPANTLTYSLEPGAPAGVSISPAGLVTWTTTEAHGPTNVVITVRVADNGTPSLSVTGTINVAVTEVNQPPVLAPIGNRTLAAGNTLTVPASATDPDLPANTLTYSLGAGAPAGASINPATGVLSWITTLAQGGTTNQITVTVTDSGTPPLSATQGFTVIVGAINTAPTLAAISDQAIDEGSPFGLTVSGSDGDVPVNILTYSLGSGAPSGMNINPSSGLITWTPGEGQGPGTNVIGVVVTDNGIPALRATNTFRLVVNEVNVAPVLAAIPNQTANIGSTLTVRATATDVDVPANTPVFSLDAGAPAGASINAASGVITWQPTTAQGGTTNQMTVRVADNGTPALSDSKTFTVVVSAAPARPPTISTIASQSTRENVPSAPIAFTIGDPDTPPANLKVSATSSNPTLVPVESIRFGGGETNLTVTVTPALDQTGTATITLSVADNAGLTATVSFDLTVTLSPPLVARPPQNLEAVVGSPATFGVSATGSKPLRYEWRFNGAPIPGATNALFVIDSVQSTNEGNYSVVVGNPVSTVTSAEAKLTVNDRLRIITQPVSQVVLAGANVTLLVAAGGKPPLGFQWRFNGTNLPAATSPTLLLPNVDSSQSGNYSVIVTNVAGSVTSDTANLVVNTPVLILKEPLSQAVAEGTNVTFSVDASGTPPLRFTWRHNGIILPGQTNSTLTLENVKLLDSGEYTVVVSNDSGSTPSAGANLEINIAPTIVRDPESQTVLAGANPTLAVLASGTAPLSYVWRFKGAIIPGATGPSYLIFDAQPKDEGDYTVVVSNAAGSVTSAAATLKVNQPLVITQQPLPQNVIEGAAATFSVAATGTAPITYQWHFGGVSILGATNATFVKSNVQPGDKGDYGVQLRNPAGLVASQPAALTVTRKVTIETQPLSQSVTNGSTVTFSVGAVGTAPITYAWLFNNAVVKPASPDPTLTLTGVQLINAGVYRAVVSNAAGSVQSADATLTVILPPKIQTQPVARNVPLGASVTFTVAATGDQPLTYQWQLNGQSIPGATAESYTIASAEPKDSGNYTVVVQNPGGAVTSETVALTLILPPLNLGNTPEATTPVETPEGTFDGGNLGSTTGLAVRKSTQAAQPATGNSRWFSWKAPTGGIVTFSTIGSNFDTYLAVYTGTTGNLKLIIADDDRGGFFNSQVTFNAVLGTTYRINVQGFGGAVGKIVVGYKLTTTAQQLPEITTQPQSQTVPAGSDATFSVQATGTALTYQWFANGVAIPSQTAASLVVRNVQERDTVKYFVRVTGTSAGAQTTVESEAVFLQIGTTTTTRSVDKFRNAPGLGGGVQLASFPPRLVKDSGGSVSRGYSGAQVFNTFGSSKEQGEPNHADEIGGASQWFTYEAVADGILKVSTEGSSFDTVLALYTGPGTDFATLKLAAFDNNSGPDAKTSVVILAVKRLDKYFIAVDGVKGATGTVKLSYELGSGPVITLDPISQSAKLGDNVGFFVATASVLSGGAAAPPQKYQWVRDGLRLSGETNQSLALLNVRQVDLGDYAVIVSNFAGASTSKVATLTINVPVTITDPPDSQATKIGETVTFSVAASGTDPLSYQWRLNGASVPGASSANYTLSSVQAIDVGVYTVVVSNPAGQTESPPATLTINQGVVITAQPASLTVTKGEKAAFSVTATGTAPFTYQWRFRGVSITNATTSTLEITNAQPTDTGEYTVVVGNTVGSVISAGAILTVRVPLELTSLPQNRTVTAGSTASFTVAANGTGPFGYQWKFNTDLLANATNANLTLPNVQTTQAGSYSVLVSAGTNVVESPPASLVVAAPPVITEQPKGAVVLVGSTVTLSVSATGTAPLSYQWSFNGTNIVGATNSTFVVADVQTDKVGTYDVKVSSPAGSASSALAAVTLGELVSETQMLDGIFQFRLTVPEGKQARVQTTTDLVTWTDLLPEPVKTGVFDIRDNDAPTFILRFYRVLLE